LLAGFATLLAAAAFLAFRPARVDPLNEARVDLGKRLYAEACASCHGASLEGQPNWQRRLPNGRMPAPPHDASGHTWHHSDEVLFRITKDGPAAYPAGYQTDMLAFGGRLTEEEIAATLAFIKSTWPPEIKAKQERIDLGSQRRKP
jgi:mono/diheme cytochrome c family protein